MFQSNTVVLATLLTIGAASAVASPPGCVDVGGDTPVRAPVFIRNLDGQTGWYASPVIADLNRDGANEVIAASYDIFVFSADGTLLDRTTDQQGRVYAPHVVLDLERDGTVEVVAGRAHQVFAWEWVAGALRIKDGWPADTTNDGVSPEVRGLAAADLDRDGTVEVIATTTQWLATSSGGAQVFVFSADGGLFQPVGGHAPAWPRYNALAGAGNDADRNGPGHSGYGCYGLNVGVGNIDNDPELEIIATYDNHHIQTFDHGLDVFTVPGSGTDCVLWPTARGGPLRTGQRNGLWTLDEIFADGFDTGLAAAWSVMAP